MTCSYDLTVGFRKSLWTQLCIICKQPAWSWTVCQKQEFRWCHAHALVTIWNRKRPRTPVQHQQTRELISAWKTSHINTTTKTCVSYINSHLACDYKYKVHKLHQLTVGVKHHVYLLTPPDVCCCFLSKRMESMYLVVTHMPGENYHRWLRSFLLCLCVTSFKRQSTLLFVDSCSCSLSLDLVHAPSHTWQHSWWLCKVGRGGGYMHIHIPYLNQRSIPYKCALYVCV